MTIDDEHERGHAATRTRSNTPDERRSAALYVCSRATDRGDATELLQALGLIGPGFRWKATGPHGPRRRVET